MEKLFFIFTILISSSAFTKAELVETAGFVQFKIPETQEELNTGIRNRVFCGGVKVGAKKYLTASHCVAEVIPNFGKIKNKSELSIDGEISNVVSIKYPENTLETALKEIKCIEHQGCYLPNNPMWKDIALIEVEKDNELPIAKLSDSPDLTSENIVVSGNELTLGTVFLKSATHASIVGQNGVTAKMEINPAAGNILNRGDSGSPVWIKTNSGDLHLIGITSQMFNQYSMRMILLTKDLRKQLAL